MMWQFTVSQVWCDNLQSYTFDVAIQSLVSMCVLIIYSLTGIWQFTASQVWSGNLQSRNYDVTISSLTNMLRKFTVKSVETSYNFSWILSIPDLDLKFVSSVKICLKAFVKFNVLQINYWITVEVILVYEYLPDATKVISTSHDDGGDDNKDYLDDDDDDDDYDDESWWRMVMISYGNQSMMAFLMATNK